MKIVALHSNPDSRRAELIKQSANIRGHEIDIIDPAKCYIVTTCNPNGWDRIFDGSDPDNDPIMIRAGQIDAVIPMIGSNVSYSRAVLEQFNHNLNIYSPQTSDGIKIAADKLISLQKMSQAKIRVPTTVLGDRAIHLKWMMKIINGLPKNLCIAKSISGSQGNGVYPLLSEYQSNVFLSNFYHRNEKLLLQQFIDAGSKDIRAIVVGEQVVVAMERTAKKGELRSNISQGGTGKQIELNDEDKEMCIKATKACGLEFAGVDLIKSKDGISYLVETNSNPGIHIIEETGVNFYDALIEHCENNYKRKGKPIPNAHLIDHKNLSWLERVAEVQEKALNHPSLLTDEDYAVLNLV